MEVVASLSQGRTAATQCGLFTYKSVPVIFEPPCIILPFSRKEAYHCSYSAMVFFYYNVSPQMKVNSVKFCVMVRETLYHSGNVKLYLLNHPDALVNVYTSNILCWEKKGDRAK